MLNTAKPNTVKTNSIFKKIFTTIRRVGLFDAVSNLYNRVAGGLYNRGES